MKLELDVNSIAGYKTFLQIKSLPIYKFVGTEAWFPDEYATRLGLEPPARSVIEYKPHPKAFDYQRDISRMAIQKRKFAAFIEPGRGKTLIDFEFAHAAQEQTGKRVLLVCPLMVVRQMIGEHAKFYPEMPLPEHIRASGLQEWLHCDGPAFGITNFESIREGLTQGNMSALIISESSMLKSHYGAWGLRLIELGRGLEWKLCETGTPAPNDRIEYANHAVFLDHFPTINSFLAKYFVNRGQTSERWELKPYALKSFYRDLSHWCIFLSDPSVYGWKDNCEPLPPIRTHIIDVPMTEEQNDAVRAAGGGMLGEMPAGGIGSRGTWARIGKGIGKGGKVIASNKPQIVADLARGPGGSIIWAKYNQEQDDLYRLMPDAANISGDTEEDDRLRLIEEFQSGKRARLLTKGRILGLGMNLQVARRHVFSTVHDSYEEYFQCLKRSNRTGSKYPLDAYLPLTEAERPMLDTVLKKADRVASDTKEQEQLFRSVASV